MVLIQEVSSLLKQAKKIVEKYDAIDKVTGGKFNIFTILERDRSETRHSRFISELLNVNGSHGQNGLFLKLFYELFSDELSGYWIGDKTDFDIETFSKKAKAYTEQSNSVNGQSGFIDIVIETDSHAIIIENKIDAVDQHAQLHRYALAKKGKNILIIYLTLDGKAPSPKSKGDLLDKNVALLSYSYHIVKWLTTCINASATLPTIRETLIQYESLIRKITYQNEENMEKEMVELLLQDNNVQTAQQVSNALSQAKAELELEFWKEMNFTLAKIIEKSGFKMWESQNEEKKMIEILLSRFKQGDGVIWFFYQKANLPEKYFSFAIGCDGYDNRLYIGCYPHDKDDKYIEKGYSECANLLEYPFEKRKHYQYFGEKRDFYGDGIFELMDASKRSEFAINSANDLKPILENLKNRIDKYEVDSTK